MPTGSGSTASSAGSSGAGAAPAMRPTRRPAAPRAWEGVDDSDLPLRDGQPAQRNTPMAGLRAFYKLRGGGGIALRPSSTHTKLPPFLFHRPFILLIYLAACFSSSSLELLPLPLSSSLESESLSLSSLKLMGTE